jgi:hypothetical protein
MYHIWIFGLGFINCYISELGTQNKYGPQRGRLFHVKQWMTRDEGKEIKKKVKEARYRIPETRNRKPETR